MLESEVNKMRNLTLRMSDEYLDLDLLDEQARDILGQIRSDEVIVQ
jgi:cell division protein FtsB